MWGHKKSESELFICYLVWCRWLWVLAENVTLTQTSGDIHSSNSGVITHF